MEHARRLLPLASPSDHYELEDSDPVFGARQPLSNSAGNAQSYTLASTSFHYEYKGTQPGSEMPSYSASAIPSQPQQHDVSSELELRRQSTRKRRQLKLSRNPIVDSPQYRAYRERQTREGDGQNDSKWPDVLEDAFLDALIELPQMQRRKYSFRGKPHGRNELITEYLWIAYQQSLPPGSPLDQDMRRTRKQVSSHIQVLKAFLRDHPARSMLFPKAKPTKNGFQESFKDDPCLKALSEGRLPGKGSYTHRYPHIKPAIFWLVLKAVGLDVEEDIYGVDGVLHQFSKLSAQPRTRDNLESIPHWRDRFPLLQQLQAQESVKCPIVHMDVSLDLLTSPPAQSSQLLSRTMLSIPGSNKCKWQIVTTLGKPPELCSDDNVDGHLKDPPINQVAFFAKVGSVSETETLINVPFPAAQFAYILACLVTIQQRFEDEVKGQSIGRGSDPMIRPAREYIEKVSMFQELQSQATPGAAFIRRAIFVWTFHEAMEGEPSNTTWRYLDPTPLRRMVMSPSPHLTHQASAIMNDNYHNWTEAPLHMQHVNLLDSYRQGLVTPPETVGYQSPFGSNEYSFCQQPYEIQADDFGFISAASIGTPSTIVNDSTVNIESFLSNAHENLAEYEQHAGNWQLPLSESFDTDPAWANYQVPTSTPGIAWDTEPRANAWPETELSDVKQFDWVNDTSHQHDEWSGILPTKHINYAEQNLIPWTHDHRYPNGDAKYDFAPAPEARMTEEVEMNIDLRGDRDLMDQHETIESYTVNDQSKITEWNAGTDDGFDYIHLSDGLKA